MKESYDKLPIKQLLIVCETPVARLLISSLAQIYQIFLDIEMHKTFSTEFFNAIFVRHTAEKLIKSALVTFERARQLSRNSLI